MQLLIAFMAAGHSRGEGDVVDTTLESFLAENEFDATEMAEITTACANGDVYFGGGGAAAEWIIGKPAAVMAHLAGLAA